MSDTRASSTFLSCRMVGLSKSTVIAGYEDRSRHAVLLIPYPVGACCALTREQFATEGKIRENQLQDYPAGTFSLGSNRIRDSRPISVFID